MLSNEPKMNSIWCPSKTAKWPYLSKGALVSKYLVSLLQLHCLKTGSNRVVRYSLAKLLQKWLVVDVHIYVKIWRKLTHLLQNADFELVFDRSASAITPSEKLQSTWIASLLWAFQWA